MEAPDRRGPRTPRRGGQLRGRATNAPDFAVLDQPDEPAGRPAQRHDGPQWRTRSRFVRAGHAQQSF